MKKYFDFYKSINILSIILSVIFLVSVYWFVTYGNCVDTCTFEFKNGFLDPMFKYTTLLIIAFGVLLFFPSKYFKHWLLYIFSWFLPLSLLLIFSESPYNTGGFLGLAGREFNAMVSGYFLVAVTIVFISVKGGIGFIRFYKKKQF